jgi:hypothetical protein
VPEPILVAISAALAGKAVQTFYDFVRTRISGRKRAVAALEAAKGKTPDSPEVQVLAAELERIDDPQFHADLREHWNSLQHADTGGVANDISGTVHGKVVQARDIHGNITFQ